MLYSCCTLGGLLLLAAEAVQASLESDIEAVLSRPAFANATVGVQIRRLEAGETVYTHNGYLSLIPASNQKLLTSSVALATLGSGFQYNTTVHATSAPTEDGVLDGDLYLRGTGDPSLSSSRLAELARAVADTGLRQITGAVIGDGSRFDSQLLGTGWSWDDEPFDYSAQVSGLNCDRNVVNVSVTPGPATGDPARVMINGLGMEEETYVQVETTVETISGDGEEDVSFDRRRARNIIVVSGTIPVNSDPVEDQITVEDPAAFSAYRFALALREAGIEVSTSPGQGSFSPENAVEMAYSESQPLPELLNLFMKPSDNLYGEALLKTAGYVGSPEAPGSSASGVAVSRSFLQSAQIRTTGVSTVDGSGLSRMDAVTTNFLCDLLGYAYNGFSEADRQIYFDALPIGGVDGTLSNRFRGTPLEGKVHAKTGSLTGVSSLSGYLVSAGSGENYLFSIMMNHASSSTEARRGQDDIVTAIYNS